MDNMKQYSEDYGTLHRQESTQTIEQLLKGVSIGDREAVKKIVESLHTSLHVKKLLNSGGNFINDQIQKKMTSTS